jgi:hypothetical protein
MISFYFKNEIDLKKAIIETVAFFDLFDFSPTASEIRANLNGCFSLPEVQSALDDLSKINSKHGQYFLPGRESIINIRQKRYNYYYRKLKIARRFARLFSFCPGVEVVCLANVIGRHNLRDESDIDFFIITAPGKIWQARLYCAGLAAILNKRPSKKNKRDKICLSFYVSASQLNLSSLKLKPFDPYFDYWLKSLVLLYNKKRTYEEFLLINGLLEFGSKNKNIDSLREPADFPENNKKHEITIKTSWLERISRFFQLIIMNPELKAAACKSNGVVINNNILKLYLTDNRQEYLKKYGNKLQQVFAKND